MPAASLDREQAGRIVAQAVHYNYNQIDVDRHAGKGWRRAIHSGPNMTLPAENIYGPTMKLNYILAQVARLTAKDASTTILDFGHGMRSPLGSTSSSLCRRWRFCGPSATRCVSDFHVTRCPR